VIAPDHPDRAIVLEDAPSLGEPVSRKVVIDGEAVELVPIVVDRIDAAALGSEQVAAELEIVRWVGEDHVDALLRQACHFRDAVALEDAVVRKLALRWLRRAKVRRLLRDAGDQIHGALPLFKAGEGESARTRGQARKG
jgi:hypothetical protein